MDNTETLATFGYTRHRTRTNKTRGHQEWTIQRHWQHLGTQDTGRRQTKQGAIKNGQYRDTGNIWVHKTQDKDKQNKGQSRIDNSETLATLDTQDTGRRQTKQGAIKNGQYRDTGNIWVHKTQDEDKQNTTQKAKKQSNTNIKEI